MMAVMDMNYLVSGRPPGRAGNAHQSIVPYEVFRCADGHLILAVSATTASSRSSARLPGTPEWAADPRFAKNADRVRNRAVLVPLVAAVIAHAHAARVARRARARRRALRADQHARPGVRRPAGRRRAACASTCRTRSPGPCRRSRTPLRFSATPLAYDRAAAAARRAHGGGAARAPRAERCRRSPSSRARGADRDCTHQRTSER